METIQNTKSMNTDTPETDRAASRDYSPLSVPYDFARNLERQRNNLQRWKDEQLIVESQWDAQAIGKELNLPLGGSIRAGILPAVQQLKAALEREQMRLVACDVIAMCDTPESAAEARQMHPDYESAALDSVKRRVDECIALRQMVRELRYALLEADHSNDPTWLRVRNKILITKANQLLL